MQAKIEGKELVIRIPVNDPLPPSKTGKTLVVASSQGNKETDVLVNGCKVIVGLNAYIKEKKK